jgi:hypothetical protein
MELDEQGWAEMTTNLAGAFAEAEAIRQASGKRLSDSGEEPISATVGILGFESPSLPPSDKVSDSVANS